MECVVLRCLGLEKGQLSLLLDDDVMVTRSSGGGGCGCGGGRGVGVVAVVVMVVVIVAAVVVVVVVVAIVVIMGIRINGTLGITVISRLL